MNDHRSSYDSGRREVLLGGLTLAVTACASGSELVRVANPGASNLLQGERRMGTITTKDGTSIFYKDWGKGQPIVFCHGWPLNSDAWDEQLMFFAANGYRAIAHDRRGHGRSSQPWDGHDMNTYADDLAAVMDKLELRDAILVGHSTGGGEVTRYLARHGGKRVAKAALVGAVPPWRVKAPGNPNGIPMVEFDKLRAEVAGRRSEFYRSLAAPFYGLNREGSTASKGLPDQFWLMGMQCSLKAAYDCIKAFSETDFTEDLKSIETPTLVIHGADDQIVPIASSALLSAKLLRNGSLKVYPDGPHGLMVTHREQFNADLLAFAKS
jgi:non-heme chloroperoxidase